MDPRLNLLDFSKMRVDVSRVADGATFLATFPEYAHLKAYKEASDDEIVIAILLCDRQGPFSNIKNYEQRLIAIFAWRGFEHEGAHAQLFQEILTLKNDHVAEIWTVYLADLFDHEWVSWFSNSVLYYQLMAELRKPLPVKGDDEKEFDRLWNRRIKFEDRSTQIYKKMKEMEDIIFIDDTIKKRAHQRESEKKVTYPEMFSEAHSVI